LRKNLIHLIILKLRSITRDRTKGKFIDELVSGKKMGFLKKFCNCAFKTSQVYFIATFKARSTLGVHSPA